jgi:hypothetical protein
VASVRILAQSIGIKVMSSVLEQWRFQRPARGIDVAPTPDQTIIHCKVVLVLELMESSGVQICSQSDQGSDQIEAVLGGFSHKRDSLDRPVN